MGFFLRIRFGSVLKTEINYNVECFNYQQSQSKIIKQLGNAVLLKISGLLNFMIRKFCFLNEIKTLAVWFSRKVTKPDVYSAMCLKHFSAIKVPRIAAHEICQRI